MNKAEQVGIVIMDFSGIYGKEQFWKNEKASWIDLQKLSGTNCYCDREALEVLRKKIADFPVRGIHFIDSGNYHYMSRIWLERLKEPFCLLVFDNHTDMQPPAFGGLLSCGGWIASALEELENLKEVILVGPDEAAYEQVDVRFKEKVRFFSRENLAGLKACEDGMNGAAGRFFRELPGKLPLYISIDKDILCKQDASTAWSQGEMSLEELKEWLEKAFQWVRERDGKVAGVDICGEQSPDKGMPGSLNDKANRELLELIKRGALFEE